MFATNIAAMNAARKNFGTAWKNSAYVEKVDGKWTVQLKPALPASGIALLTEIAGKFTYPTRHAMEVIAEQRRAAAAFFANRPAPAPESDEVVAEFEAELARADRVANNAIGEKPLQFAKNEDGDICCPCCGTTEVFQGEIKPIKGSGFGTVEREDEVRGCHHCGWHVDDGKASKVWVRQSTILKPTKAVWHVADEMVAAAIEAGESAPTRKQVQDECVRRGIASGTARTQYQAWKKANDDSRANAAKAAEISKRFNG